jgi:hypothetical protein
LGALPSSKASIKELNTLTVINMETGEEIDFNAMLPSSTSPVLDETSNLPLTRANSVEINLPSGQHSLLVYFSDYKTKQIAPWASLESPFPPPSWPGSFVGADLVTKGNWIGKYGADGYILFGYSKTGGNLDKLPPYIHSYTVWGPDNSGFNSNTFTWVQNSTDARALQDPLIPRERKLGGLSPDGSGSALVDVFVTNQNESFFISIYVCDFGPNPKWSDGQTMDLERTMEIYLLTGYPELVPLVPRQYLRDFQNGQWLVYEILGNFRFRISTIRGEYAVASAIMFDTKMVL